MAETIIKPNTGPQEVFLSSRADVALYGGAAGGGKSFALLLQPLLHIDNAKFSAVIFRRTTPQIFNAGGLWDSSTSIYSLLKARPRQAYAEWIFPSGAKVKFAHMEYERSKREWDGSQIALICFDELTSFTASMFWYMLSRNRSTCGIRPYMRASCNPDADSWVAELVSWWIDQDTGYPIPERSGVIRWFVRDAGKIIWFDSKKDAARWLVKNTDTKPEEAVDVPKSFTFIPAKLSDNKQLTSADPGYRANLLAMEHVERERLLGGNWKIRPAAGLKFPRDKWKFYDAAPQGLRLCRYWDKAGTEGGKGARTAGGLMGMLDEARARELGLPRFWVVDVQAERWNDAERESQIKAIAQLDQETYGHVTVGMEQEPGSGGKHSAWVTVTSLAGFDVFAERATTNKSARWTPLAAQQQVGNVGVVKGDWDWAGMVKELDALAGDARTAYGDYEGLDRGKLKDIADALSGAFKYLTTGNTTYIAGDLLASGGSPDEHRPFDETEVEELPDFLRDIVGGTIDRRSGSAWED